MPRKLTRRDVLKGLGAGIVAAAARVVPAAAKRRPNILWIVVEDMNDWMSCYGHDLIKTPTFDAMAARGVRFTRFYVTAPVCSASRSGLILGCMQTTHGAHHHRSSRMTIADPRCRDFGAVRLSEGVRPVTRVLQDAGYATFVRGKTDYNFIFEKSDLDSVRDWNEAAALGKPWFAQVWGSGGKGGAKALPAERRRPVSPEDVTVPPYYPDCPEYRKMVAGHYADVLGADASAAGILEQLRKDGQLEDTVVFFLSDHGMPSGLRHKQFCYEGGIRVPLIVRWPENFPVTRPGLVRDDLLSGADIAATTLGLAGVPVPEYMEGRDVFAPGHERRDHVLSARDRCDFTIDRIRAVVTERCKYIRNFMPERPWLQPQYRDGKPVMKVWKQLHREGKLTSTAAAFLAETRPPEELYDLRDDPHEVRDLAGDPAHAAELARHRRMLERWIADTDDKGRYPEGPEALLQVLARWGDRCVNPEYDAVRERYAELLPSITRSRERKARKRKRERPGGR
ncbi:MAG: sulfatase family protein [Planctomycetota bacterium]|jgi:arylsulfatase A-like enzyme